MPRFYLHICNGSGFVEDKIGVDFPDLSAARADAVKGLRDIIGSEVKDGVLNMASFIEIEDQDHNLLTTVAFTETVQITSEPASRPGGPASAPDSGRARLTD